MKEKWLTGKKINLQHVCLFQFNENNQSDDKAEPQGPEATASVLGCKSLYRSVSLMRKKNI